VTAHLYEEQASIGATAAGAAAHTACTVSIRTLEDVNLLQHKEDNPAVADTALKADLHPNWAEHRKPHRLPQPWQILRHRHKCRTASQQPLIGATIGTHCTLPGTFQKVNLSVSTFSMSQLQCCNLLHANAVIPSCWPVLTAGQSSLAGLLLSALSWQVGDKLCKEVYHTQLAMLALLCHAACYAVTVACDDSRARQAVIGQFHPALVVHSWYACFALF